MRMIVMLRVRTNSGQTYVGISLHSFQPTEFFVLDVVVVVVVTMLVSVAHKRHFLGRRVDLESVL
jgi:hypothetical protein